MDEFYGPQQRALQQQFDSERLADRMVQTVVRTQLGDFDREFIGSRDMFFLSTIDHDGWPTVSYKGGGIGFVRVVDDHTLAFPSYDGNGMFLSMGNIAHSGKVGLLFIDLEQPRRLRVHGTATVSADDALMVEYPEATLVVRIAVQNVFINCGRYIHTHERKHASPFVPTPEATTPVAPWKSLEVFEEVLPAKDRKPDE